MAIVRISAGMYKDTVTGKTVKANDAAAATKMLGGGKAQSGTNPTGAAAQARKAAEATNRAAKKAGGGAVNPTTGAPVIPAQFNTVNEGFQADVAAANYGAGQDIKFGNANVNGVFGGQNIVQNPDGTYQVNQYLDPAQQETVNQDTALSQMGRRFATERLGGFNSEFNPNLTARVTTGSLEGDRARIEEAVYGRLTRNTDRDFGREKEGLKQELFNRGIPLEEIESRPEMQALNERYDTIKADATDRAVETGGNEYSRNFGINEQMRANDYSQQAGSRSQNFGEISQLSQYGTGAQLPNLPQFQGADYQGTQPTAINESMINQDLANKNYLLNRKQVNAAIKNMGRGSSGGQQAPQETSPFQV